MLIARNISINNKGRSVLIGGQGTFYGGWIFSKGNPLFFFKGNSLVFFNENPLTGERGTFYGGGGNV